MTWMTSVVASRVFFAYRQGDDSSQDEKGASSILAAQLDEELGGGAVQVTDDWLTILLTIFLDLYLHL